MKKGLFLDFGTVMIPMDASYRAFLDTSSESDHILDRKY